MSFVFVCLVPARCRSVDAVLACVRCHITALFSLVLEGPYSPSFVPPSSLSFLRETSGTICFVELLPVGVTKITE